MTTTAEIRIAFIELAEQVGYAKAVHRFNLRATRDHAFRETWQAFQQSGQTSQQVGREVLSDPANVEAASRLTHLHDRTR